MKTRLDELSEALEEYSDDQIEDIFKKADKLQRLKKTTFNSLGEDMNKGSMRNVTCPNCLKKFKKCNCGVKESDASL
jgi:hypothetical protein